MNKLVTSTHLSAINEIFESEPQVSTQAYSITCEYISNIEMKPLKKFIIVIIIIFHKNSAKKTTKKLN